ncbi:MAG TPA: AbrB/MazE/SpoVT family DNA-binding domain-containing protein [Candidatus Kapabacteria bacterium]|nr:AbrB/MazE/SpoVT family DNA-binding domain-containing protein [Candidatus Kapabacteria bacterium]
MEQAIVSTKYQIVIPQSIRKEYNIVPGQRVFFVKTSNGIQLIPQIPLNELFGKLEGINTEIERDEDRL